MPNASNVHPGVFPDMSEFQPAALAPSGFHNRSDGSVVQLYSEFQHDTQEVHFRWMEYGIDGVFLQPFTSVSSCKPQASLDEQGAQQGGVCDMI